MRSKITGVITVILGVVVYNLDYIFSIPYRVSHVTDSFRRFSPDTGTRDISIRLRINEFWGILLIAFGFSFLIWALISIKDKRRLKKGQ